MLPYLAHAATTKRPRRMRHQSFVRSCLCSVHSDSRITYLFYDNSIALVVYKEPVHTLLVLLPILEVDSHIKQDISPRAICCVELAELVQFTQRDEEVVFSVSYNNRLEACQQGRLF